MLDELALLHEPQTGPTGCMYHAAFALTGEPALLDLSASRDVSEARFMARLAAFGLLAFPFWVTPLDEHPTPETFWRALNRRLGADGVQAAPLLVSFRGPSSGWLHTVAVMLPTMDLLPVEVSDSNLPDVLQMTFEQFLASDYARAYRVEMLGPIDLTSYPEDLRTPGAS